MPKNDKQQRKNKLYTIVVNGETFTDVSKVKLDDGVITFKKSDGCWAGYGGFTFIVNQQPDDEAQPEISEEDEL